MQPTVFGQSVEHRPLIAWRSAAAAGGVRLLVVGIVHGDETAGNRICQALLHRPEPTPPGLLLVPDLNPDGVARHTRQNAHGVDLNRNFPYRWRHVGAAGDQQFSGSGPLSEPESRAMAALIRRYHPTVTVWFHQPVGVVDESGGSLVVERSFARALGLPLRKLTRYPGSAASWQNASFKGSSAFVVELPRHLDASLSGRAVRAVLQLAQ
jgi:protein MpaA